jgi:membrane-bound lytic murein transglycosylase MltF
MIKNCPMRSLLVLVGILFSIACVAKDSLIPLLFIKDANWTNEEAAFIKALHRKGSIHIATKTSSVVYLPHKDGSISGFHYSVLKEFADLAKIDIDIELVVWDEYFYKQNKDIGKAQNDPNYSYIPTLIDNVDIYLDGITALPWREKMFDIVKFIPTRQMVISRKDNLPNDIADLNNRVCAMVKHTSMERKIEQVKNEHHINIIYNNTDNFDAMDKMVSEGNADFTVYDSDRAFSALKNYSNLTIAWPLTETQIQGWGVNKNNKLLKSILEKYIKYAQETGALDKYWKISYGVTFVEYLKILNLGVTPH